jgi:hypothetical protein
MSNCHQNSANTHNLIHDFIFYNSIDNHCFNVTIVRLWTRYKKLISAFILILTLILTPTLIPIDIADTPVLKCR